MVIIIVVLSYASAASAEIGNIKNKDDDLKSAYSWIGYGLAVGWPIWIGIVVGLIVLFIFGPELIPDLGSTIVYLGLLITFISLAFLALSFILGAYYTYRSTSTDKSAAQGNVNTAALLSAGTIILLIIAYWYIYSSKTPTPPQYQPPPYQPQYEAPPYQPPYEAPPYQPPPYQPQYQAPPYQPPSPPYQAPYQAPPSYQQPPYRQPPYQARMSPNVPPMQRPPNQPNQRIPPALPPRLPPRPSASAVQRAETLATNPNIMRAEAAALRAESVAVSAL